MRKRQRRSRFRLTYTDESGQTWRLTYNRARQQLTLNRQICTYRPPFIPSCSWTFVHVHACNRACWARVQEDPFPEIAVALL